MSGNYVDWPAANDWAAKMLVDSGWSAEVRNVVRGYATLRAENALLREALAKYGKHSGLCDAADNRHRDSRHQQSCTCGLKTALTGGPHG